MLLLHDCGMERSRGSLEQVWIDLSGGSYFLLKPQSIWQKVNHNCNMHDILTLDLPVNRIMGTLNYFVAFIMEVSIKLIFFQGKLKSTCCVLWQILPWGSPCLWPDLSKDLRALERQRWNTHTHTQSCLDSVKFHQPSALFHSSGRILQFEFSPHFDSEKVSGSPKQNSCAASLCCCWTMECAGWISRWSCLGAEKPAADLSWAWYVGALVWTGKVACCWVAS